MEYLVDCDECGIGIKNEDGIHISPDGLRILCSDCIGTTEDPAASSYLDPDRER